MYICVLLLLISCVLQVDSDEQSKNNSPQPPFADAILRDLNYQSNSSFQAVVDLLQKTTDLSQKPCQNFNEFACGNYDTNFPKKDQLFDSLSKLEWANQNLMFTQLQQDSKENEVLPVKTLKQFYKQCTKYIPATDNSKVLDLLADIRDFQTTTNIPFQALANSLDDISLNFTQIGLALGKLYNDFLFFSASNTNEIIRHDFLFIEPVINLRTSSETDPYLLTIPDNVDNFCRDYNNQSDVTTILTTFFQKLGGTGTHVTEDVAHGTIQDVVDILELMKLSFCSSSAQTSKPNKKQGMTAQQINDRYHTIDFKAFLKQFSSVASAEVQQKMNSDNFLIWLVGNGMLDVIDAVVGDPVKVCGRKIANLFYFNIIRRNIIWNEQQNGQVVCFIAAKYYMPEPLDYLFIRALVPEKKERDLIRSRINTTTQYTLRGFRSMVEQVSWLSPASRAKVIAKLDNMGIYLVSPKVADDDQLLEELYRPLQVPSNATFFQTLNSIRFFATARMLSCFVLNQAEREYFGYPTLNSASEYFNHHYLEWIGLQSGIFGAIGFVLGHEITHGFDKNGVQYDEYGYQISWMDNTTQRAFDDMSQCIVQEYSQFCPINTTNPPRCVNGTLTVGENLADNAGIHASYRGFQHWKDTVGKEPNLPGNGTLARLNNDQLFFLAMANSWCTNKVPDVIMQADLNDEHSPDQYRIRGVLPNFLGFKNAFDCKLGDVFAPKQHCDVWITEVMHNQFMSKYNHN